MISAILGLFFGCSAVFLAAVHGQDTPREYVPTLAVVFAGLVMVAASVTHGRNTMVVPRYCTAELTIAADTVEYLRENRECVDVVLDDLRQERR